MLDHIYYVDDTSIEEHIQIIKAQIRKAEILESRRLRQQNRVHLHQCPTPRCKGANRKHYAKVCPLDKITKCYPCRLRERRLAGAA